MQAHCIETTFTVLSVHSSGTSCFASDPSYIRWVEEQKDLILICFLK